MPCVKYSDGGKDWECGNGAAFPKKSTFAPRAALLLQRFSPNKK